MKKFFVSGFVCLFMALRALALDVEVPQDKIVGAEKLVALGEVVRISLPKLDTSIKYLSNRAVDWKVFDGDSEKHFIADGENIILGTGITAKKFKVMAAVSYLYLVKDEKTNAVTQVEVRTRLITDFLKVGSEVPPPPPPSPPTPPAPIVFPDGKYKLSKTAYDYVYKHVPSSQDREGLAKKLATNYEGLAASIAAGAVKNGTDALINIGAANRSTLGTNNQVWDAFFIQLQDYMYNFYTNRQLVSADDFRISFLEIAAGLKAVR